MLEIDNATTNLIEKPLRILIRESEKEKHLQAAATQPTNPDCLIQ